MLMTYSSGRDVENTHSIHWCSLICKASVDKLNGVSFESIKCIALNMHPSNITLPIQIIMHSTNAPIMTVSLSQHLDFCAASTFDSMSTTMLVKKIYRSKTNNEALEFTFYLLLAFCWRCACSFHFEFFVCFGFDKRPFQTYRIQQVIRL